MPQSDDGQETVAAESPYAATGITRIINAFLYSMAGLRAAWTGEEAFRQEALLAIVTIPLGYWLGSDSIERVLLMGSILLVLIVELLNTAVEMVVDRIGAEHNELSGKAKDIGSAAVFLSLLLATLVWLLILT